MSAQAIELIKRIIADDTADLRERLQHLEHRLDHDGVRVRPTDDNVIGEVKPEVAEKAQTHINDLQARLEKIKAIHRLDATPVQWTRDNAGKMVEAPEGLWEIQCVICRDIPPIVWRNGDSKPPQCMTWRLADGQE